MSKIDITGVRYGRLVVVSEATSDVRGNARWLCRCDCGEQVAVLSIQLRKRLTRSCGCLRREASRDRGFRRGGRKMVTNWEPGGSIEDLEDLVR